jgi:glycosyltransferase involved in cell wall biosynthesis
VTLLVDATTAQHARGIRTVIEGILSELPRLHHDAIVAAGPDLRVLEGVRVRRIPGSSMRAGRLLYQRLLLPADVARLRRGAGDVDRVLLLDSYVPLVRPQRHLRYATLVHDVLPLSHPRFWPMWNRLVKRSAFDALRRARPTVFTSSEFNVREIRQVLGLTARVVTFGCGQLTDDEADAAHASDLSRQEPYLLSVGAIEPRKDTLSLLEAFDLMGSSLPSDLRLLVVGSGRGSYSDAVRRRAARSVNSDRIEFLHDRTRADTLTLIARARALLFPSLAEGFGLPILEALALGTPVVASDIAAIRSWAGDVIEYAAPGLPTTWVVPTLKALDANHERRRAGQEFARAFRWRACAAALLDF